MEEARVREKWARAMFCLSLLCVLILEILEVSAMAMMDGGGKFVCFVFGRLWGKWRWRILIGDG